VVQAEVRQSDLATEGVGDSVIRSNWRSKKFLAMAAGLTALSLLAFGACSDDDDNGGGSTPAATAAATAAATEPSGGGSIDYSSLRGEIRVDGSSTVFPVSEAVAEEFTAVASGVRTNVGFSGTGGGFEKFCRGEIQVSNASRPIKDSEVATCEAAGITDIVELQVSIDALTIVAHPDNDYLECLTVQQLHDIFTGTISRWNEVDPSFPDQSIIRFFPGTDSGTFDYFVEAIIEGVDKEASHTGDGTASEDDNVLAQGVEGNRFALGYFGFAYFQEAGQKLKAISVDGGDGCVEPSLENATDNSYQPLSRPLFIYTTAKLLETRPEVLGFINFYLENTNVLTEEVGYVPMSDELLAEQVAKIEPFLP
jgi:phosphate transport system substrate-binding protein